MSRSSKGGPWTGGTRITWGICLRCRASTESVSALEQLPRDLHAAKALGSPTTWGSEQPSDGPVEVPASVQTCPPESRHEDVTFSNLLGAEEQVLPGDADQEEGVQLLKVLGAQGEVLHAGEVQLHRLLQQRRGLLFSFVLPGRQKGLQENQHLWRQAQVLKPVPPGHSRSTTVKQKSRPSQASLLEIGGGRRAGRGDTSGATRPQRALTSDFPRDCRTSFRNSSWCSASSRWPSKIWHQLMPRNGTEQG